jgi:hypothetical protein
MKHAKLTLILSAALILAAAVPAMAATSDLLEVRRATADFRSVPAAEAAGYERFLDCFESAEGGMGQHYVDVAALDSVIDPLHPEAMVYEVRFDESRGEHLTLVAVEWVVPGAPTDEPPELFGEHFHFNPTLGIWALHAWLFERNPSGMFADWNPNVAPCP